MLFLKYHAARTRRWSDRMVISRRTRSDSVERGQSFSMNRINSPRWAEDCPSGQLTNTVLQAYGRRSWEEQRQKLRRSPSSIFILPLTGELNVTSNPGTFSFFLSFYFRCPREACLRNPETLSSENESRWNGKRLFRYETLKRDRVTHENESLKCISKCVWMDVKGGFSRGCGIRWKF